MLDYLEVDLVAVVGKNKQVIKLYEDNSYFLFYCPLWGNSQSFAY